MITMAKRNRKIPPKRRRALISEAGGKCANPGCSAWQVEIHHIKKWAVYQTHDAKHMIAICPNCHTSVHYGKLEVSDEVIYRWKGIERSGISEWAHIYIEPASDLKLLTGTICVATTNEQLVLFELSNSSYVKFRVIEEKILKVSMILIDQRGNEILRVSENDARVHLNKDIIFQNRPGHIRVTMPATNNFIPDWLLERMQKEEPLFVTDGRIIAIDIEVLKPGLLRIQGCWSDGNVGFVITEKALYPCSAKKWLPAIIGSGEGSVLVYTGPNIGAFLSVVSKSG
jgi:hypothetical protein